MQINKFEVNAWLYAYITDVTCDSRVVTVAAKRSLMTTLTC